MQIKAQDYKPNEILRFVRQYANKTQEELASSINRSKSWVKHNEQGLTRYYFEDLIKVANACGIEIILKNKTDKN